MSITLHLALPPRSALLTELMSALVIIPSPWLHILLTDVARIRALSAFAARPSFDHALEICAPGVSAVS
jgi:hypothetical protein